MTVNKVILVGNLGADPETRTTQTGTVIAKLRIATSERQKDRDGNWADHTEWHRVTCFGRTAENVARFLSKGRQVYIEGKLRTSSWEKEGQKQWSTEVIADQVRFLQGGNRDGGGGGGGYQGGGGGGGYQGGGGGGYQGGSGGGGAPSGGGGGGGGYGGPPAGQDDDIPF